MTENVVYGIVLWAGRMAAQCERRGWVHRVLDQSSRGAAVSVRGRRGGRSANGGESAAALISPATTFRSRVVRMRNDYRAGPNVCTTLRAL